jgi:hypothetical protein
MNFISWYNGIKLYTYPCIESDKSNSTIFEKSLISRLIPMNEKLSWYSNHVLVAPMGYSVSAMTFLSIIFIIIGVIFWKYILGRIIFLIGIFDIIYTFLIVKH